MGQYFLLVNTDRKEYVAPPGLMKDIERTTDPIAAGMHVYLTLQGDHDGVSLPHSGSYVGRWAGDRVAWVGDYDPSGLYDETAGDDWDDITDGVIRSMKTVPALKKWLQDPKESVLSPDMIIGY